jgi:nitrogen fixation/metabolism regulation signal transduction histidine kinase
MTRELKRSQEEVAALERENACKEMARQVAHEIKNPLTPMKLSVQHLLSAYKDKSPKFDAILEKVLSTLLKQIETLNQIAGEFSRFARMPSFSIVHIDIIPLIREITFLFKDEHIKLEFLTNVSEAVIDGDEFQFKRMLINFIRNSIQANANIFIIRLEETEHHFELFLQDNGSGIPEEYRQKIFQANFTTKSGGMGLGLKLSKRFIEGIGGSLFLLDTSDNGTTFKIIVPKISTEECNNE